MDEGLLRVRLYGDSLALPRPGVVQSRERYIARLCSWWTRQEGVENIELIDRSRGSMTVADLWQWYEHDNGYFGEGGDVLLIQCGVVDCAPRPLPRWLRSRLGRLPSALRRRVISFLHRHRPAILRRTGGWRQISPDEFRSFSSRWLASAVQKFGRVYVFNIAPTNRQIENHSPGFTRSIRLYNEILAEVIGSLKADNLFLVDVYAVISQTNPEEIDRYILAEDGHHLTALSHELYYQQIKRLEENWFLSGASGVATSTPIPASVAKAT